MQHCRRIFLQNHEAQVRIGAHDFERDKSQRVLFNVELFVPYEHSTPQADKLTEVVDYDFVRQAIAQRIAQGHIELQETLCDDIAKALLAHPHVQAVRLSTRKPDVYPDTKGVGVEVLRVKDSPVKVDAGNQTLTLTGLRFNANLGILKQEQEAPQPIQVDAELNFGPQPLLPRDDDIKHVLDYRKVRQIIIDECRREHINLLESLVGKLANRLMQLPGVIGARVKITKLEIFDDCEVAIRAEAGHW
jgi:dihydroneopterin aldolase